MEILILVLLYYLSQNADFSDSVKPLMEQLKDSEKMLSFLKDLSAFSQTFSAFKTEKTEQKSNEKADSPLKEEPAQAKEKDPQSPTSGIADAFIQGILDSYLKKQ